MQLTQQQLWYVERLADPSETRTHQELAEQIGVDRATLWRWRRIKGFGELVFAIALLEVKADLGQIFGVLSQSAKRGDLRAIRLVFELSGILQAPSGRNLFSDEVYTDYLLDEPAKSPKQILKALETEYTVEQRRILGISLEKALNDINFIKLSIPSEEITMSENVQMQFS